MNRYLKSQERFKFLENPVDYIGNIIQLEIDSNRPHRRWLETRKHYLKRLDNYEMSSRNSRSPKSIKRLAEEYSKPTYVYYGRRKIKVPDDFYLDYKTPDIEGYICYLAKEDERRSIVTDEDREKARLLNCDLDYNYLQTLINKMNLSPDLVVTIRTRDGAVINMRKQDKNEDDDILNNNLFISAEKVK